MPKKKKKNFFWKKLNVIAETSIQRSSLPSLRNLLIAVFEKSELVVYVGVTPYYRRKVGKLAFTAHGHKSIVAIFVFFYLNFLY